MHFIGGDIIVTRVFCLSDLELPFGANGRRGTMSHLLLPALCALEPVSLDGVTLVRNTGWKRRESITSEI